MHFYNPSPLSLGYIPRGSYRPALVPTYLDDESSSALAFEGLSYPAFSHSFSPRLDAETRYRRALHELQSAEKEFEAHLTLKRARQAAILREQAARRERALAVRAEVERIERARALQYERHQRAHQAQVALDRARRQEHALRHASVDANPRNLFVSERLFAEERPTHSGPSCRPVLHEGEAPTLEGFLKLFSGIHPQLHGSLEQSGSPAPSQHRTADPQPSDKQDAAADALNAVLEHIHGLVSHAGDASSESETIPEPSPVSQPQAAPVDEKGKGKARTEPAAGPTFLQALLGAHAQGSSDQELKDIELAIKLSLEDCVTADAKKAGAAKATHSSPGASSSKVKVDGAVPSSHIPSSASNTTSITAKTIPGLKPVSPLTTIRAVRNQLSALESTFKFPAVFDFNQSVLAVSPNNAPLRVYENTLNGLLEQLDAIESDGDEEVRNVRSEVVREVEKALEDLVRRVSDKASKLQVTKDIEVKVYDAQDAVPADATLASKGAEATRPELSAVISPTDADVDLAISVEYLPSHPAPKPAVAELGNNAVAQTSYEDVSSLVADGTARVLEDYSDSTATITANYTSAPSSDGYVTASPVPETFLASMSHDQFAFPPKPTYSDSDASPVGAQEDAVLADNSNEGGSEKSGEDGWSEVDA